MNTREVIYVKVEDKQNSIKCQVEGAKHFNDGLLGTIYIKKTFAGASTKFRITVETLD